MPITPIDELNFILAIDLNFSKKINYNVIGTLKEKGNHKVLKSFIDSRTLFHERKIKGFIVDVYNENGIFEVQTRSFERLIPKLKALIDSNQFTIVFPVIRNKEIHYVDLKNSEVVEKRKSSKKGNVLNVFPELYKIKSMLWHPNFALKIIVIDIEEYRLLDGYSSNLKKGATKFAQIPTALIDIFDINDAQDLLKLIPFRRTDCFTTRDFSKVSKGSASCCLNVLKHLGMIEEIGRKERYKLYRIKESIREKI